MMIRNCNSGNPGICSGKPIVQAIRHEQLLIKTVRIQSTPKTDMCTTTSTGTGIGRGTWMHLGCKSVLRKLRQRQWKPSVVVLGVVEMQILVLLGVEMLEVKVQVLKEF